MRFNLQTRRDGAVKFSGAEQETERPKERIMMFLFTFTHLFIECCRVAKGVCV